jgi:DNA-binding beta-propeller fold protein YncE
LLAALIALPALLLTGGTALAAGDVEHSFARAFKATGACTLTTVEPGKETGPGAVAVNETTGEVFVFDRGNDSLDQFDSSGNCLNHVELAKKEKPGSAKNEGLAVDNSSGPSQGDVYVVEGLTRVVKKFKPNGGSLEPVGELKEAGGTEFVEIHGLGVDGGGDLYVYDGKGVVNASEAVIHKFSNEVANAFVEDIAAAGTCPPRLGFAVGPNAETFYVGRSRTAHNAKGEEICESPATVMAKVDAEGNQVGEHLDFQLDNTATPGVAVDSATGEVYFSHTESVSAFTPQGDFVQRFANEPGPGQLSSASGIATASNAGDVYVADGSEIKIYAPSTLTPEFVAPVVKLADGREWEQVTPQNKLGSQLFGINKSFGIVQASPDGNALTFVSSAPIVSAPPTSRAPEPTQNLARRGATSWSTEDVISPAGPVPAGYPTGSGTQYEAFAEDLSAGLVNLGPHMAIFTKEPLLSPEASEDTPYIRDLTRPSPSCEPVPSTCYAALVSPLNDTADLPFGKEVHFMDASSDLHHAVLRSSVPLTGEAIDLEQEASLYEWSSGGRLELVSVPPPAIEGQKETPAPREEGEELRLGGPGENFGGNMRNAISSDGKRVVWSTARGLGRLYVRDTAKHETLRVDRAQGITVPKEKIAEGACSEHCAAAQYQTADTLGKRIFFTDVNPLTPDSTQETGSEGLEEEEGRGLGDLYVCEVEEVAGKLGCKLEDVTAGTGIRPANEPAAVQGVLGASNDGSTIYFVADAQLTANAGPGRCVPRNSVEHTEEQEGLLPPLKCTLYVAHRGAGGWETKLVSTITTSDQADWNLVPSAAALRDISSRVSPEGGFLTFMSDRRLTGYDNRDASSGKPDEEVYLYDRAGQHVSCVSCNPSNVRPHGVFDHEASGEGIGLLIDRPQAWENQWVSAVIPGWTNRSKESANYQPRYLNDEGRLFFNSADPLVPDDKSAKADVYEFEPNGIGTCHSATGCISLMSSGTSENESAFIDASANGNSMFFITSQKLLSSDEDTGFDIYNARVCTPASPCLKPPGAKPPPCGSEAECKGGGATIPASPPVPASTLGGGGNVSSTEVLGATTTHTGTGETRDQKLKKALKACKKLKKHKKRHACEKSARTRYGPVKSKATKARK